MCPYEPLSWFLRPFTLILRPHSKHIFLLFTWEKFFAASVLEGGGEVWVGPLHSFFSSYATARMVVKQWERRSINKYMWWGREICFAFKKIDNIFSLIHSAGSQFLANATCDRPHTLFKSRKTNYSKTMFAILARLWVWPGRPSGSLMTSVLISFSRISFTTFQFTPQKIDFFPLRINTPCLQRLVYCETLPPEFKIKLPDNFKNGQWRKYLIYIDPRPSTYQSTSLKSGSLFLLMVSVRPYVRM